MVAQNGKFAVVLLSGGLDSMVAGGLAREAGYRVLALTIDYNPVSYTHLTLPTTPYV